METRQQNVSTASESNRELTELWAWIKRALRDPLRFSDAELDSIEELARRSSVSGLGCIGCGEAGYLELCEKCAADLPAVEARP